MFDQYDRNIIRWRRESRMIRASMIIAIIQVIFFNNLANGKRETALGSELHETYPTIFNGSRKIVATDAPEETLTCTTPGCYRAASTVQWNMNPDVDPCDNFYNYACGGFLNKTIIPEDKSSINSFSVIGDKLKEQLRDTVEAENEEDQSKSFRLAKNLYKSCMNKTSIEASGLEPLRKYLRKFGEWPVVVGASWKEDEFDWKTSTYKLRDAGYSFDYLISFGVSVDMRNSSKRVLGLDQADLGLSREYLTKGFDDKIVSAYYSYLVDIATMLGANADSAKEELRESLIFEMKLANISLPAEERRDATKLYNPMTLAELTKTYPNVPWKEYFSRLLPPTIILDEDEVIIVSVPIYITNVVKLIEETKPRVLANYLMWRAAQESIKYLNNDVRKRQLLYSSVLTGRTKSVPRWKTCIALLGNAFPTIIGSMYVRKYFNEDAKKSALEMVTDIREQFTETLRNTPWMDNETRQNALEKAEAMYSHIAYPNELLDVKKIDNIYRELELSEDNYFENVYKTSRFIFNRMYGELRKPVNKTDWESHGYAYIVNAFYSPSENSIQFPAGILQGVFFDNDRPKSMNYGGIGSVIGHEITHGFDDEGRQFDKHGNLVDWWTSITKEKFLQRSQCIIDQYSNYFVEEVGLKLNGIKSQGENIADNGGIKQAYYAYKKWVARNGWEPGLPGIDKSPEQLFWISTANVWCSKTKPDAQKLRITTGVHVPDEFRIVGPFSNSEEFSNDFHCPEGSRMNPTEKCHVW